MKKLDTLDIIFWLTITFAVSSMCYVCHLYLMRPIEWVATRSSESEFTITSRYLLFEEERHTYRWDDELGLVGEGADVWVGIDKLNEEVRDILIEERLTALEAAND